MLVGWAPPTSFLHQHDKQAPTSRKATVRRPTGVPLAACLPVPTLHTTDTGRRAASGTRALIVYPRSPKTFLNWSRF